MCSGGAEAGDTETCSEDLPTSELALRSYQPKYMAPDFLLRPAGLVHLSPSVSPGVWEASIGVGEGICALGVLMTPFSSSGVVAAVGRPH